MRWSSRPIRESAVLSEIAASDRGILGFNAEQTLSVWRDGGLAFP
jgi:hypothetical protein